MNGGERAKPAAADTEQTRPVCGSLGRAGGAGPEEERYGRGRGTGTGDGETTRGVGGHWSPQSVGIRRYTEGTVEAKVVLTKGKVSAQQETEREREEGRPGKREV